MSAECLLAAAARSLSSVPRSGATSAASEPKHGAAGRLGKGAGKGALGGSAGRASRAAKASVASSAGNVLSQDAGQERKPPKRPRFVGTARERATTAVTIAGGTAISGTHHLIG